MTTSEERTPPGGDAWRVAQAAVSDRNEQAKKAGRAEKAAYEKKLAALKRVAEGKRETFH